MPKKIKIKSKKINTLHAAAAPKPTKVKKNILSWLVLISIISILCLFPMLNNDFTNWDDDYYVINNALLRGPDWKGIFTESVVGNYHPLTVITLAINYQISELNPSSYLLVNLLLHVINTCLVFYFIWNISGKKTLVAFLTALIFGIHPLHVESVAWVSERKDVLYTLFFVLALIQYWRFLETNNRLKYWLCFLFFTLSLLSKPAAIIFPLVLLLVDYWKGRRINANQLVNKIPFFFLATVFAVITIQVQTKSLSGFSYFPLWERLFFACYVVMIYFIRFFIPYPLSAFHPYPSPDHLGWPILLSPIFIIALLTFLWYQRKNKLVVFSILFFLVNLLLVLQIISIGLTIVAERYTYVPYIGLAFILAMLSEKHLVAKNNLAWIVTILVVGIFGFLSFSRTRVWKDSISLWSDVISHYPREPLPMAQRAQYLYNKAIAMPLGEAAPLFHSIIEDCTAGIHNSLDSLKPVEKKGWISLYYMRAVAYNSLNQYDKAFGDFNHFLNINPGHPEALYYRGTLLANQYNKNAEAIDDFNKAIQLNPQGKYYLNRSICYFKLGDMAKAKADGLMAEQKGEVLPDHYKKILNL